MTPQALKIRELVDKYNEAAATLGANPVKKFKDHKTAVRRTTHILGDLKTSMSTDRSAPPKDGKKSAKPKAAKSAKPKAERMWTNFLGMRQDLRPAAEQVPLKVKNCIRADALVVLLKGATLEQLVTIFDRHDKSRKVNHRKPVHRAYEMVRILCYNYGYGTRSSKDGKTITLITR